MSLLWKSAAGYGQISVHHEPHGDVAGRFHAMHPDEERPIGSLSYVLSGDDIGIDSINTRPQYQGQGIASALLDAARAHYPGKGLVTEDHTSDGKPFLEAYERRTGVPTKVNHPGEWFPKTAVAYGDKGTMSWDEVQAKHPSYDVRPIEGQTNRYGEYSGTNEDHGWAVSELAHGDGDGEREGPGDEHDLPYTHESVHVDDIKHEFHPRDDPRVQSAMRGYKQMKQVPPPLLVKRAGEYHVADGHHRISAAKHLGISHLPSIVAHSPRSDRLEY